MANELVIMITSADRQTDGRTEYYRAKHGRAKIQFLKDRTIMLLEKCKLSAFKTIYHLLQESLILL